MSQHTKTRNQDRDHRINILPEPAFLYFKEINHNNCSINREGPEQKSNKKTKKTDIWFDISEDNMQRQCVLYYMCASFTEYFRWKCFAFASWHPFAQFWSQLLSFLYTTGLFCGIVNENRLQLAVKMTLLSIHSGRISRKRRRFCVVCVCTMSFLCLRIFFSGVVKHSWGSTEKKYVQPEKNVPWIEYNKRAHTHTRTHVRTHSLSLSHSSTRMLSLCVKRNLWTWQIRPQRLDESKATKETEEGGATVNTSHRNCCVSLYYRFISIGLSCKMHSNFHLINIWVTVANWCLQLFRVLCFVPEHYFVLNIWGTARFAQVSLGSIQFEWWPFQWIHHHRPRLLVGPNVSDWTQYQYEVFRACDSPRIPDTRGLLVPCTLFVSVGLRSAYEVVCFLLLFFSNCNLFGYRCSLRGCCFVSRNDRSMRTLHAEENNKQTSE